jgi:hypothetical protein
MPRIIGIVAIVAGVIMIVAGIVTWFVVKSELAAENIVVSEDADNFAGQDVDGPFTAYAQAEVIQKHALEAGGGLTYAEIPQEDPTRDTVMNASFLRASLFTSVVSFGVALLVVGLGVIFILFGLAFMGIVRQLNAVSGPATVAEVEPAPAAAAPVPADEETAPTKPDD